MTIMKLMAISSLIALSICSFVAAGQGFDENYLLVFPSFTDTVDSNNWRSWVCINNPWNSIASATIYINDENGNGLGSQYVVLMPGASYFVRPRNIVGFDCRGAVFVISDNPIAGILEKTRNNNQMTNSYSAPLYDLQV